MCKQAEVVLFGVLVVLAFFKFPWIKYSKLKGHSLSAGNPEN